MADRLPRVFSIAPDCNFLDVLAREVLAGFPLQERRAASGLDLARCTILLPTRRAVRELEDIFFRLSGGAGLLLPRIRPIGDIDEDLLDPEGGQEQEEIPLSQPGQILVLMDLIDDWAASRPDTLLARELAAAPHRANGLAQSLAEVLDTVETEDIDPKMIAELYGLEAARHREAILEFLDIVRVAYPRRLAERNTIGPMARRSLILRREARRLTLSDTKLPFIAAGSTGSIPATRALLKSIAGLANGAVVLPGLDAGMDEPSWQAAGPTHPQHALKQLVQHLGIARADVVELGPPATPRRWLLGEIMHPAETAHLWRDSLKDVAARTEAAMDGIELVETRSLPEQATTAALILREALETPGRTACLVTPDRQLARRVKAELRRWNIAIDDSAGEPLVRFGGAALLNLLLEAVLQDFSGESLAALLRHPLALFGSEEAAARRSTGLIEMALLRAGIGAPEIGQLSLALRSAKQAMDRPHAILEHVTDADWEDAFQHAARASGILAPLAHEAPGGLGDWLDRFMAACEAMAGEGFWQSAGSAELQGLLDLLRAEAHHLRRCDRQRAITILRHWLHLLPVRQPQRREQRLLILGLLEARLVRADLMILAGLTEGVWPGAPDCGAWINRPMRDTLGMKQPESQIGQTAHDFVQAIGAPAVKLLWSKRLGDQPATPTRWIHRLQMILAAAGLKNLKGDGSPWPRWARLLSESPTVEPQPMPHPKPPAAARPRRLSVTRIETLIRDPYAIYARHVLRLEPVPPISAEPDPARRGTIFHAAIGDFLRAYPVMLPADPAAQLEALGREHFKEIAAYPGLVGFWWPRFERIARWFAETEPEFRAGLAQVVAETTGRLAFDIAGEDFLLTCRADRIDVFSQGAARIVDYKTGAPPSKRQVELGLNPQLTLQAAILDAGGFVEAGARPTGELAYIRISGGDPAGEVKVLDLGDVMQLAHRHLSGLKRLLAAYANPAQAYLPRTMVEKDEDPLYYDHLSRFREWTLSGDLP